MLVSATLTYVLAAKISVLQVKLQLCVCQMADTANLVYYNWLMLVCKASPI